MTSVFQESRDYLDSISRTRRFEGKVRFNRPIDDEKRDQTLSILQSEDVEPYNELLQICSGITIEVSATDSVDISFVQDTREITWPSVYPRCIELSWCGELEEHLLVLDLDGRPGGQVYHVSHDPPSHAICFNSLSECLQHLIETDKPMDHIKKSVVESHEWPCVSDVNAEDVSLREFLSKHPPHYWVHDLCGLVAKSKCHGFPYLYGPDQFHRYADEQLWVQERPKGIIDRAKWFCRTGSFG